jgi:hypothetical protein
MTPEKPKGRPWERRPDGRADGDSVTRRRRAGRPAANGARPVDERLAELLRAGRWYIRGGWPVFILSPSKAPVANCEHCKAEHLTVPQMEACSCLSCHSFYRGTLDADRFAEMAAAHPRGLLACRTGEPSGTAVVDVDPQGLPKMREFIGAGLLPRTATQQTGRSGYHLVYAHPGVRLRSGANKIAAGIDSKSDGGYIVVAPSVHPQTGRAYRWLQPPFADDLPPLPQHWVARLREPKRSPRAAYASAGSSGSGRVYGRLRGVVEHVLTGPPGDRNGRLYWAGCRAAEEVAAGRLDRDTAERVLVEAALGAGLRGGEAEALRTVRSAMRPAS